MEEQQGLAAVGMGQAPTEVNGNNEEAQLKELLVQVMQALMNGITPEELIKQGIPREIVEAAMQLLQQEAQQNAPQTAEMESAEPGLAALGNSIR